MNKKALRELEQIFTASGDYFCYPEFEEWKYRWLDKVTFYKLDEDGCGYGVQESQLSVRQEPRE